VVVRSGGEEDVDRNDDGEVKIYHDEQQTSQHDIERTKARRVVLMGFFVVM
jgi:hypothetical protein